ncbi:GNAT family N-acetyltransferase [Roseobacter sp. HKCCA0434]|uniref:GNAT family N-acetyltransferase n=1 Tax=Roseobacter sp. HKCCA0434 TaxID=3079297 RepID=UPI002905C6B8|nr:GNAT family N-acetyltransferase [Roseobacter sp. HKCCA0434]
MSHDLHVTPYRDRDAASWDAFVDRADNGHFQFRRAYMDYHRDRFADASVMVRRGSKTVALFPAARVPGTEGREVVSHAGLTFGGPLLAGASSATGIAALAAIESHYRAAGVARLGCKPLPDLMCARPRGDLAYALHRRGWQLTRRELSSVIDLSAPPAYARGRKDNLRKARAAGLVGVEAADPRGLWPLIERVLADRHSTRPTHDLSEITRLHAAFPHAIRLHEARAAEGGPPLAGAVLFLNGDTVHTQYLASGEAGRGVGALDFLIDALIEAHRPTHRLFSFGISTEDAGRTLNEGLLAQKEGFGATGICHDRYDIAL